MRLCVPRHFAQLDAASGGFDIHVALASGHGDAASGRSTVYWPLDLSEAQAAASRLTVGLADQVGDFDTAAGGLEVHVEFFRHRNHVTNLQVAPLVAPAAFPVLRELRMDTNRVFVLGKLDFMVFQDVLRRRLAFAADFAEDVDFDLFHISRLDLNGTAVRL